MVSYTVNIEDIETALLSLGGNAKAKDIQNQVLEMFCGGKVPQNYQNKRSFDQTIQRNIENYCPQAAGYDPSKKDSKFLRIGHGRYRIADGYFQIQERAIGEETEAKNYPEGATTKIYVNSYERNPRARQKCIEYYGLKCSACEFNFERVYGEAGKGFIHVHHMVPLATVKKSYRVNPVKDLRPLCANCHAIVHRTTPALTIDELVAILKIQMDLP